MPRKMKVRLDAKDSVVEGLSIGAEVEVIIKGKVVELEASSELEFGDGDTERFPATLGVEYESIRVKENSGVFAELAEDLDGD